MKKRFILFALVFVMLTMPIMAYASGSGGHSGSDDDNRTYVDPAAPKKSSVPAATTAENTYKQSTTANLLTPGKMVTAKNGALTFQNADGTMLKSSWAVLAGTIGNVWKYFDENGNMVVNKWVLIKAADGKSRWYYLGADGTCYMNGITPDGFTVDATGAWYENNRVQLR